MRVIAAVAFLSMLVPGVARAEMPDAETRASVPALVEMHEVIFPLWHTAWPNRDTAQMIELLPRVREHVTRLNAAELPGILRDKREAWAQALAGLNEVLKDYEHAAAAKSPADLANAVEALHSRYEGLVRLIRPAMKELDAYHVVLYRLYHHELPGKSWAAIATSSAELAVRCEALAAAPTPRRAAAIETQLRARVGDLCAATAALKAVASGQDSQAITAAVEAVHDRYREVEALFQ